MWGEILFEVDWIFYLKKIKTIKILELIKYRRICPVFSYLIKYKFYIGVKYVRDYNRFLYKAIAKSLQDFFSGSEITFKRGTNIHHTRLWFKKTENIFII